MTTFAERFVAELHGKPAPSSTEDEACDPGTIFLGGVETIAENCNVSEVDYDAGEIDDSVPEELQEAAGVYHFKDGSRAGLRYHFGGKWDAWVMRG